MTSDITSLNSLPASEVSITPTGVCVPPTLTEVGREPFDLKPLNTKVCCSCLIEKHLKLFSKSLHFTDGSLPYCVSCELQQYEKGRYRNTVKTYPGFNVVLPDPRPKPKPKPKPKPSRKSLHVIMAERLRRRLRAALKGADKSAPTMELIGCSPQELIAHLESLFQPGMSWEKRSLIHIDHIRPCASFDLTDPAQQRECFHYTNLQPLWAKDNQSKSDKLDWQPPNSTLLKQPPEPIPSTPTVMTRAGTGLNPNGATTGAS